MKIHPLDLAYRIFIAVLLIAVVLFFNWIVDDSTKFFMRRGFL